MKSKILNFKVFVLVIVLSF
ncbi:hypothetical protein SY1_20070 [Fretibacterium fastidiosum]|uniref:Uncharacterized protein n=1 Tax=Fretibacterium fastidiosum TaxID=651822 RepID=A0AB94IYG7_9BACT|nr:hypothetical protein SY1_20070 [Fretibacterium fastidiosum]